MTRSAAQKRATMRNWYIMRLRGAWFILGEIRQFHPETDVAAAMKEIDHILRDLGAETQADRIRRQMGGD